MTDHASGHLLYLEEVTHRVANEYAMAIASISLAASGIADPNAKTAMKAAAQRLQHYAEAHRALQAPSGHELIDLAQYLRGLCGAMVKATLAERNVSLVLVEADILVDTKTCWRIGMMVSELVTNAVRHAFGGTRGTVLVEMSKLGGEIYCRVSDDGCSGACPSPGRGTRIVKALATELGGAVEWTFRPLGASVLISFPTQTDCAGPGGPRAAILGGTL